jgi:hypothetical protein
MCMASEPLVGAGPQDHAVAGRSQHGAISFGGVFKAVDGLLVDRERPQVPAGETGNQFPQQVSGLSVCL